jgi:sugar/nucleoside kinase (ribokinase family)
MKYGLIGIGAAVVDVLSKTSDSFLTQHGLNKGTMQFVDGGESEYLYSLMTPSLEAAGGAGSNTLACFASLGGKCGLFALLGDDYLGKIFKKDMQNIGVDLLCKPMEADLPTARCLIFVAPDSERTMRTYIGDAENIRLENLDLKILVNAKIVMVEGYSWRSETAKATIKQAAKIVHKAGGKLAFTLSVPHIARRYSDELLPFLKENIDILIGNEEEYKALFDVSNHEEALFKAKALCPQVAFTCSERGAYVADNAKISKIDAVKADELVDSTGAGDAFAAGFLYGLSENKSVEESGYIGSIVASEAISHIGAHPKVDLVGLIKHVVSNNHD